MVRMCGCVLAEYSCKCLPLSVASGLVLEELEAVVHWNPTSIGAFFMNLIALSLTVIYHMLAVT